MSANFGGIIFTQREVDMDEATCIHTIILTSEGRVVVCVSDKNGRKLGL